MAINFFCCCYSLTLNSLYKSTSPTNNENQTTPEQEIKVKTEKPPQTIDKTVSPWWASLPDNRGRNRPTQAPKLTLISDSSSKTGSTSNPTTSTTTTRYFYYPIKKNDEDQKMADRHPELHTTWQDGDEGRNGTRTGRNEQK